ncbi:MAG: TolC family protein [Spirulina sp. SIO3F2]|nr:TolC family protein [Spirulina sp. SIO3F2]
MHKVRSLIVVSKGAVASTVTGAVVALGTQSTAVAQTPFPFTAATRSAPTPTTPTNLPPFPETPTTAATPTELPPFPEAPTAAATPTELPPFPEAPTAATSPHPVAQPVDDNPIASQQTAAVQAPQAEVNSPPIPEASATGVNPENIEAGLLELNPSSSDVLEEPMVSDPTPAAPAIPETHLVDNVVKTQKIAAVPTFQPTSSVPLTLQQTATNPIRQSFQATTSPTIPHQTAKAPKLAQLSVPAVPLSSPSPSESVRAEVDTLHEQRAVVAAEVETTLNVPLAVVSTSTQQSTTDSAIAAEPETIIPVVPVQQPEAIVETHRPPATRLATLLPRIRKNRPQPQQVVQADSQPEEPAATGAGLELPTPATPVENNQAQPTEARIVESDESIVNEEDILDEIVIQGETAAPAEATPLEQLPVQAQSAEALIETPSGRRQEVPPPDFLNPSGNPLLFPTEADEVAIDITQPITLEQALALARRNNQDLQSARLNLERAYAVLKEARAGLFPSVDGTVSLSRTNSASTEISNRRAGALSTALGNDATTDTLNAQLAVSYDILDGGQTSAEIRSAKHSLRFSQLEVEELTEEIHLAAAQDYYALQEADQQVVIETAAVEQAQQTLRDAELLLKAGLGTRFDVIRAKVELANSDQDLTQARANQAIARRGLVRTLGLGQQVEVTTADEVRPVEPWALPLEETIVLAYRNRAELEQRLIEREIEEEQRQIALATLRPRLNLFATYDILDILDDDIDGSSGYSVGAQVTWNFFDGGAARARKRQAEIDLELAEVAFEQERNTIRLEVEDAYYNFTANQKNIKTAATAVQLAEESLRLARLRFQAGVGTQTDVIDAQTELTRAKGNLLTAIITYNNSIASLRRAVSNTPDRRLFDLP